MVDSIGNPERQNRVFVLGGPEVPGNIISYRESLRMVFEALGREPRIISVPNWALTAVIRLTGFVGLFVRGVAVLSGFLKVVHYYLVNDMRAPGYGSMTFRQHVMDTTRELQS